MSKSDKSSKNRKKANGHRGELIIIGGAVSPDGGHPILDRVVSAANSAHEPGQPGTLAVVTAATRMDEETRQKYTKMFTDLGVKHVEIIEIERRADAEREDNLARLETACSVFFTGGDQLRITSQLGGTPFFSKLQELYERGCTIAGTSAGAMAMAETMLAAGPNDDSVTQLAVEMAPGLNLVPDVIIDSHFAERGRIGRLLGAIATNPQNLGLGIDEATAVILNANDTFQVLGEGAVYVVDGEGISHTSWSDDDGNDILTLFDVRLHVLANSDCFDLRKRRPIVEDEKQPA